MRIRIGPVLPRKETKDRIPNTFGTEDHANQEIDYMVDSANQAYETALKVDGVEYMLWRKTREGRNCTCKEAAGNTTNPDSRFEEFNTPTVNSAKSGETIRVRGSWDRQNVQPNAHGKELGVDIGVIKPDDGSDEQYVKQFPAIDQREVDAFLQGPLDMRFLQSGENTTACGICFGTGYTNGYSLYNGVRATFDSINTSRVKKFAVDRDKRPYVFKTSSDSSGQYVEWDWEIPLYFKAATALLVRNNLDSANSMMLQIRGANESSYQLLTKLVLQNYKGQKVKIRAVPNTNSSNSTISFTHVEIILQFSDWPMTQVGQFQETTNQSSAEAVGNMEFNVAPSINQLDEGDVIVEFKYNKVWLISDVTDLQTAKNRILNWTAQARSLTSFDILSLLKLSRQPNYSIAYQGLEGDEDD